jgi:hypothetical protein
VTNRQTGRQLLPVIEDLATHDMSPNAPAVGPAFVAEPIVAQDLGIEVVRLERGVVDVRGSRSLKEKSNDGLQAHSLD